MKKSTVSELTPEEIWNRPVALLGIRGLCTNTNISVVFGCQSEENLKESEIFESNRDYVAVWNKSYVITVLFLHFFSHGASDSTQKSTSNAMRK